MENIILTMFMRIGDEVVVNAKDMPVTANGQILPNGTKGVVVGFYRYKDHVCYSNLRYHRVPGIYECNGAAYVEWENGLSDKYGGHEIAFTDQSIMEARRNDAAYRKAFDTRVKIGDLPKLPFMVGMTVQLKKPMFGGQTKVLITRIDWANVGKFCYDGVTPYPIYTVTPCFDSGVTTNIRESDILKTIDEGNYYWWEHDKTMLKFDDLKSELSFYASKGFVEQVKDKVSNSYVFDINAAVKCIEDGAGDFIRLSNGLFGTAQRPMIFQIIGNDDLKNRVREVTLSGFADLISKGINVL